MRYERWNTIRDIFITEFGEDRVECTEIDEMMMSMVIYFPEVKVTCNESGKSIMIQDCFVQYRVKSDGRLYEKPGLARTTVSKEQYISGYKHSHTSRANSPHEYARFSRMCLGNSPMDNTVTVLTTSYDETSWDILATETAEFLKIESIKGVPYIMMSDVSSSTTSMNPITYNNQMSFTKADSRIVRFSKMIYSKDVFMEDGISFIPNNSDEYWVLKLTEKLKELILDAPPKYFENVVYKNGMLYTIRDRDIDVSGDYGVEFKGRYYKFNVTYDYQSTDNVINVIKPEIYSNIMSLIRLRLAGFEVDDDTYFL